MQHIYIQYIYFIHTPYIILMYFQNNHALSIIGILSFFSSTSKSNTSNFVSSVPFLLPTAQTSFVLLQRTRHTTPPLPPLSRVTRLRRNSPLLKSQIFTVPSSEEVITNFLLNCKHVTALWCLFEPESKKNCTVVRKFLNSKL